MRGRSCEPGWKGVSVWSFFIQKTGNRPVGRASTGGAEACRAGDYQARPRLFASRARSYENRSCSAESGNHSAIGLPCSARHDIVGSGHAGLTRLAVGAPEIGENSCIAKIARQSLQPVCAGCHRGRGFHQCRAAFARRSANTEAQLDVPPIVSTGPGVDHDSLRARFENDSAVRSSDSRAAFLAASRDTRGSEAAEFPGQCRRIGC